MTVDVDALERWIRGFAGLVAANRELLTQLDSAIGDADHGVNMDRGMTAVVAALDSVQPASAAALGPAPPASAAALLKQVGMTLVSTVGGASGPLYGTFFLRMATAAGDVAEIPSTGRGAATPATGRGAATAGTGPGVAAAGTGRGAGLDGPAFAKALRAGLEGVVARGKAEAGDKTMYDALAPAVDALDDALAAGAPLGEALRRATRAAEAGRDATIPMRARKGRASYLGERSVGHQDPGATSSALLIAAAAAAVAEGRR